ncbi:MFS transporter [Legionella taurinensis]|uniref:MFS transporter n=1 Tax=Legionella taurinensis TaxID=70611 RepID=A0A3A5LBC9_9GAMM|nr:MFS transporter [Legionella taurinensis]RJT49293.1 MFS transporter [Legionella taurinensis]RJT69326.1 MFS transporter [Legionella taurinensis]STY26814.1 major facilitator family transporter [Legionella taurinensis]
MSSLSIPLSLSTRRILIWLVGVSFVLFQFFLQLSSGVIIGAIMVEMKLSALMAGFLSSSFYYVYTSLQIPVGILFDRANPRFLLTVNALLCSLGCFLFAHSEQLWALVLSRLMIGAGSSFAFVGLSLLLREHFPIRQFAFMIGLSETLGFLMTMLGMICLGGLITHWGWRFFVNCAGTGGIVIAFCCWQLIPPKPRQAIRLAQLKPLLFILKSPKAWFNGLFVGLSFTVITVFGALWAIPFLQIKLNLTLKEASFVDAFVFLGAAVSCPLFGYLAGYFHRRTPLMLFSCLSTAVFLLIALFMPIQSSVSMAWLMFLIGVCCGAYMLSYSIANELAPQNTLSTCTGFTNTLAMLTAPLLQPLVGYFLDFLRGSRETYTLADYQWALVIVPCGLIIAAGLALLLPDKNGV